jgi:NAD(P)-dependent dehydrogenase (short-subunit alcohol dehydrogenase family)
VAKTMVLAGKTAVVTGAASGIGRAIARSLARSGCHLALADVNEAGLAETARLIAPEAVRVSRHILDVADRADVAALPNEVRAQHAGADILVNNAGVALGGTFEEVSEADFEWLFEINFWGVVRMTRAFLPLLKSSDDARIVNLSSIFGLIAPPGQVAYSASKFAVRGFSEALRNELDGTQIGVTVVHPGGVATSIAENARLPHGASAADVARRREWANKHLKLPPERAGEIIAEAIERRRPRVLVGADAKWLAVIERAAPVAYWSILRRFQRPG